jgi:hypothetical protein
MKLRDSRPEAAVFCQVFLKKNEKYDFSWQKIVMVINRCKCSGVIKQNTGRKYVFIRTCKAIHERKTTKYKGQT